MVPVKLICQDQLQLISNIYGHLEKSTEYGSHHEWNDNMGRDKVLTDARPIICSAMCLASKFWRAKHNCISYNPESLASLRSMYLQIVYDVLCRTNSTAHLCALSVL